MMALLSLINIEVKRFLALSILLFIILTLLSSKAFAEVTYVDSFNLQATTATPTGLAFNTDGTKMFVMGYHGDEVNEYTLSTGFDVSTTEFVDGVSVRSVDGVTRVAKPYGLAFNTDGTKMFVTSAFSINIGGEVLEYTLSTGFDVSTASFVDGFSVFDEDATPIGLAFNTDGTKMFVMGYNGKDVNE